MVAISTNREQALACQDKAAKMANLWLRTQLCARNHNMSTPYKHNLSA
jgi:hypothetical protein